MEPVYDSGQRVGGIGPAPPPAAMAAAISNASAALSPAHASTDGIEAPDGGIF